MPGNIDQKQIWPGSVNHPLSIPESIHPSPDSDTQFPDSSRDLADENVSEGSRI